MHDVLDRPRQLLPNQCDHTRGGLGLVNNNTCFKMTVLKAVTKKNYCSCFISHEEDYDRTDNSDHKPDDDNEVASLNSSSRH